MNKASQKHRAFAICLATLAWLSVLLQCCLSLQLATQNGKSIGSGVEIFLSYFTVLTNLLMCVSLTASLATPWSALGKWFSRPDIVAGIATSIAFVGLSYHFLLRNTWNPQGARRLADVLLHYVIPTLYVLYWWFDSSKVALRWIRPLTWSVIGSYPYPFIDAASLGYGRTILNSFGLLFVFIALGLLFVALGRTRQLMRT